MNLSRSLICLLISSTIMCVQSASGRTVKRITAIREIAGLKNGLENYYSEYHRYPTSDEGLKVLKSDDPPGSNRRDLLFYAGSLTDPWGTDYKCVLNLEGAFHSVGVYSCGPDRISQSRGEDADDINSWNTWNRWMREQRVRELTTFLPVVAIVGGILYLIATRWKRKRA